MHWRDRLGLNSAYFLSMAGLGFILPFFPVYLGDRGISDQTLGIIWTLAATTSMLQIPLGRLSDRPGKRRPILLASMMVVAVAGLVIPHVSSVLLLGFLAIVFAENGIARSLVENMSGAEASALAKEGQEGRALSALRLYRPAGIVLVALGGGWLAEQTSLIAVFDYVIAIQAIAIFGILIMRRRQKVAPEEESQALPAVNIDGDKAIWIFIGAMVLFHAANAPQGIYVGLYMLRDLQLPESFVAFTFVLDMAAWMLVVMPVGWLADRFGQRPMLFLCWILMVVKTVMLAKVTSMELLAVAKIIDGVANGMFAVLAALWMVERLGGRLRAGEAHAIVGTSLVFGSALGPLATSFVVESIDYQTLFLGLGAVGFVPTLFLFGVPEAHVGKPDEAEAAPSA